MHKGSGDTVVKFGVIGYGYWGPNVVRNLDQLDGSAWWRFVTRVRRHANAFTRPTRRSKLFRKPLS